METLGMEPDAVEPDEYVDHLSSKVLFNLMDELRKEGAWRMLIEGVESRTGEKVISDEYKVSSSSPERELMNYLVGKLLTVKELQEILESNKLYDALRTLNTKVPAEILNPVEDTTCSVPLHNRVKLSVDVCGSPFPQIQWYFKGNPLIGETSTTLMLKKFSIRDEGEYTCKVTQRLSGIVSELTSCKYILNVKDTAPRISLDLKDVEIKAQEDLILSFEVTGYPEPKKFIWFKNKNKGPVSETTVPQLRIQAADVNNSGEYYCRASSRAGHCITRIAIVKVEEPMICPDKPKIIKQPKANQVYFAGDSVHLTCEVLCSEKVNFTCFLNNQELIGNSNAYVTTSSSGKQHWCELKYHLTKEQMEKENWKPLHLKFAVDSVNGRRVLSDDVRVEVKTTDVKETPTARNKWALVIGNSHYHDKEMELLPCARKDIHIVKRNLTELGFRVMILTDLKRTAIQNAVKHFSEFTQKGDYVSFFYAGHGIHNDGKDYIIPVDATVKYVLRRQNVCLERKETDISIDECIPHVWIINVLQKCEPALIFSIYDTCRMMKPKYEGTQAHSSQDGHLYQTALKNSYSIFATSENYEAYEDEMDTSLLVGTLKNLMTYKISVQDLCTKVLENFRLPEEGVPIQVPKVSGDLALQLSLADPSQPQEIDESESGVLKKWEQLASGRGRKQECIPIADTKVEASIYWNIEPRKDGVTWVISNCLELIVELTQDATSGIQEMEVQIKLWTGETNSKKLRGSLSVPFLLNHLQELEDRLLVELYFTYKEQLYKKEMILESPAISQKFYKGNYID